MARLFELAASKDYLMLSSANPREKKPIRTVPFAEESTTSNAIMAVMTIQTAVKKLPVVNSSCLSLPLGVTKFNCEIFESQAQDDFSDKQDTQQEHVDEKHEKKLPKPLTFLARKMRMDTSTTERMTRSVVISFKTVTRCQLISI